MNILFIAIGCLCIISFSVADVCNSRRRWGRTCKSCSERVLCIDGGREWQEIYLGECGEGQRCDSSTGECVETKTPCREITEDLGFNCLMTGFFPDPFDCTAYYICENKDHQARTLGALKYQCPRNQYYSARTQSCLETNRATSCNTASCTYPGQMATWPDDSGFYYICTAVEENKLYPQMLRCPLGEQFDGTQCKKIYFSNAAYAPEALYSGNDGNGLRESLPSSKCSVKGFSVNPSNCRRYTYCDGSLKAWELECSAGQYFDLQWKLCMSGSCYSNIS